MKSQNITPQQHQEQQGLYQELKSPQNPYKTKTEISSNKQLQIQNVQKWRNHPKTFFFFDWREIHQYFWRKMRINKTLNNSKMHQLTVRKVEWQKDKIQQEERKLSPTTAFKAKWNFICWRLICLTKSSKCYLTSRGNNWVKIFQSILFVP